jgi:nicotinate-nucleotide adenylyltransferase
MSFRAEFQKDCLCMIVGVDAMIGLTSWYQWEKIIQLANIIVMCRKGWALPEQGPLADFINSYKLEPGENIHQFSSGKILKQTISSLDISASQIRALVTTKQTPQFLTPDSVLQYIQEMKLYGYDQGQVSSVVKEENANI